MRGRKSSLGSSRVTTAMRAQSSLDLAGLLGYYTRGSFAYSTRAYYATIRLSWKISLRSEIGKSSRIAKSSKIAKSSNGANNAKA